MAASGKSRVVAPVLRSGAHNQRELFYVANGKMDVVRIHPGPPFSADPPPSCSRYHAIAGAAADVLDALVARGFAVAGRAS